MQLSYSDIRRLEKKFKGLLKQCLGMTALVLENQESVAQRLTVIETRITTLVTQGTDLMATVQELLKNMDDLEVIAQEYLDFIIAKDALIAEKDAELKRLTDELAAGNLTIAEFQAGIDTATAKSQATEDAMRAKLPGVPPVGGTPLAVSYPDRAAFDAAVAAYTGPEAVTLDGVEVKSGTAPSVDYFTHSATGGVDRNGPTD